MKYSLLIIFIAATFCFNGGCNSDKTEEEKFTDFVFNRLITKYPDVIYSIERPLILKAVLPDGQIVRHYLKDIFKESLAFPDEKYISIDTYLCFSCNDYTDFYFDDTAAQQGANILDQIIPVIKHKSYLQQPNVSSTTLFWEEYNYELIILYALDQKDRMAFVQKDDFKQVDLSKVNLPERAIKNLYTQVPFFEWEDLDGIYMLTTGGFYENGFILDKELWNNNFKHFKGDIIIGMSARGILMLTDSEDKASMALLNKVIANGYDTQGYSISPFLFRWDGKKFI